MNTTVTKAEYSPATPFVLDATRRECERYGCGRKLYREVLAFGGVRIGHDNGGKLLTLDRVDLRESTQLELAAIVARWGKLAHELSPFAARQRVAAVVRGELDSVY